ncbi:MAG TPA: hypothetical protein VN207_00590 [Ktedonobacteraceae bacterium]|nr:hypothetical protein [Ktedonobacteraceae bacterium]
MDLSTLAAFGQVRQGSLEVDAASLYKTFEQVKDMREKKGSVIL